MRLGRHRGGTVAIATTLLVAGAGAALARAGTQPPVSADGRAAGAAVMTAPAHFSRSTHATLGFVVAAGNHVTCTLDGKTAPCTSSSAAVANLSQGPHVFMVIATDSVGDIATSRSSWVVDTTAPAVRLTSPSRSTSLSRQIRVTWSGLDGGSGTVSYDVRVSEATWNGRLSSPITWKRGTTSTSASLTGSAGSEYCFSARARDRAGNLSGWSRRACTALPLDDRSLSASRGWRRTNSVRYYAGTISATTARGRTLTIAAVPTGRAALVVARGPDLGSLVVRYNGRIVKTMSLAAARTQDRVVVPLPRLTAGRTKIVITSSTSRPVVVDGMLVARI